MKIEDDVDRFYELLGRLKSSGVQGRRLSSYRGVTCFPGRGVYFFLEEGETRATKPEQPRVVRVGTHAVSAGSKSKLWGRLRTHLGTPFGNGNHRGSIFRRHVGSALLVREGVALPTWGDGSVQPPALREDEAAQAMERLWEGRVSEYLGALPVLWVDVPDEPGRSSERAIIEQNAIALLSNRLDPCEPASMTWLGRCSLADEIRRSGLWNVQHVGVAYDAGFFGLLERAVDRTLGEGPGRASGLGLAEGTAQ
jgi:hypothetical protein